MARKGKIQKNEKRKAIVQRYEEKRDALRGIVKSRTATMEEKQEAMLALQRLPRDSSPTRLRNRCNQTGRARGYVRKFWISRIALRNDALEGKIPGVRKASW
jgi:small subunit ribosomal protein S14